MISISDIKSNGYYIGIAVSAHTNEAVATLDASNIRVARTCTTSTITQPQCEQASNCEVGSASGKCYDKGQVPTWEFGSLVASIFDTRSHLSEFGCENNGHESNWAADRSTRKYNCERDTSPATGFVITPFHKRMSVAHGLRVYAANNCPSCEPVSYSFEGRKDANSNWVVIGEGDLPWISGNIGNNILGLDISSTYSSGDKNLVYTEVSFADNKELYLEYRVTWLGSRNRNSKKLQYAEFEVPGLLEDEDSMMALSYNGDYTSSILDKGASISYFGSFHVNGNPHRLVDGSTNKLVLNREGYLDQIPGIIVTPTHGRQSAVTGMRIFTANNNPGADPVRFALQGRSESGSRVQDKLYNKCWELVPSSGNLVSLTSSCDDSNPNQRFYQTPANEIRVNSVPHYCLEMRLEGVVSVLFRPCDGRDSQKWVLDSSTGELRSMNDNINCLSYEPSESYLWFGSCHKGTSQQFYMNESFDSSLAKAWTDIAEGHLPWISGFDRNPLGLEIFSTYDQGDKDFHYMDVVFYDNDSIFMDYKISFPELRDQDSMSLQLAELELPGMIVSQESAESSQS